ncbi:DUF2884 family protein [Dyella monticola]|uniref:DUF2884 family protein n=1 Tax=Dyella monticola TaxID=1927958 RepID=A0A370WSL3_9GAMM|nr:DUF2884 family protein [Dyella monticola]RDS79093.1 DUF2884 family protein [Dyella monticola]
MRRLPFVIPMLALTVAITAPAASHAHNLQCSYSSDYDVQVKAEGIVFTRDSGQPGVVFIHDGSLRVDGRDVHVSNADAVRLREYEHHVRDLVPQVASMARDGVNIGYAAITTVVATLSDNGDERTRLLHELRDRQTDALNHIDHTLGRGEWQAGDEDDLFDKNLEDTVADLVGSITGDVVKDALSGDSNKLASLQARTDALNAMLDKAIDAPADKLGQRADALCPQLGELQRLQDQWAFRLEGGERLQLISTDTERSNKASQYAQR